MEISKIAAMYEVEDHEIKKVLQPAGFEYGTTELSPKELAVFDEAWRLIKVEGKSNKEAKRIMKQRADETSVPLPSLSAIDSDVMAVIEEESEKLAKKFVGEAPEVIKQKQEQIKQAMVDKFLESFANLAKSGELKKAFDRVLGSDNVIDVAVLPGESPALPESSSSGT